MTRAYRTTTADAVLVRFPPARRAKIKARAAEIAAEELALMVTFPKGEAVRLKDIGGPTLESTRTRRKGSQRKVG